MGDMMSRDQAALEQVRQAMREDAVAYDRLVVLIRMIEQDLEGLTAAEALDVLRANAETVLGLDTNPDPRDPALSRTLIYGAMWVTQITGLLERKLAEGPDWKVPGTITFSEEELSRVPRMPSPGGSA